MQIDIYMFFLYVSFTGAGGPEPPKKLLPTTDYLYNMTGRNISDWLVKTMKQYQKRRYASQLTIDESVSANYKDKIVFNLLFSLELFILQG